MSAEPFSLDQWKVIRWAAQECEWQQSGERSVAWMLEAWEYALIVSSALPTEHDIVTIGRLVEPGKNANGYRQCGVRVGSSVKMPWTLVPQAMKELVADIQNLDPTEWFRRYEEVHPWIDGNGRSGAILFCWLTDQLGAPVLPPNLWNDQRR